jgi:putative aldouronate transport system permease protein
METTQPTPAILPASQAGRRARFWQKLRRYWPLYVLLLPGVAYYLIFRYWPIYGLVLAFKDFQIFEGIMGSPWVGFQHFKTLFDSPMFLRSIRNTVVISFLKLVVGFWPPIILALMLNEVRSTVTKRVIQTVSYLPHFLSWVIIYGVLLALLGPARGLVNQWIKNLGGDAIPFLTDKNWFVVVLVLSDIWRSAGWGAIIYLAGLTAINPTLYEAATIDGASRLQQVWHISIPGIRPVIVLLLILRLGYMLDAGFEQIYILYNPLVYGTADIIDTWVFRNGIEQFRFSIATAASVFRSVIGLLMVLAANRLAKRFAGQGIW